MEGWADLFKHFLSSKLSSFCLLITSAALFFGHHVFQAVPPVPESWNWVVFAVMIFTATQCIWWTLAGIEEMFKDILKFIVHVKSFPEPLSPDGLSDIHKAILRSIEAGGVGRFIGTLDRAIFPDQLALEVAIQDLVASGLITAEMGFINLSGYGQRFVLKYRDHFRQQ
jgi:hypothetical protein